MITIRPVIKMTPSELQVALDGWRRFGDSEYDQSIKAVLLAYGRGDLVDKSKLTNAEKEIEALQIEIRRLTTAPKDANWTLEANERKP